MGRVCLPQRLQLIANTLVLAVQLLQTRQAGLGDGLQPNLGGLARPVQPAR